MYGSSIDRCTVVRIYPPPSPSLPPTRSHASGNQVIAGQTPAFCIYSNVRKTETEARVESYYGTLSLYVPEGTADGREKINNICKYGDPDYQKPPPGVTPEKNLLADKNLLCAGKFFTEAKWNKNKNYMAGLPAGAPGCMHPPAESRHVLSRHRTIPSKMSVPAHCPCCITIKRYLKT